MTAARGFKSGEAAEKWPEPKVTNPDIADPTGIPYIDCLIHRLLDAQQDINYEANTHMSQSHCDAAALIDEVETTIRRLAARSLSLPAPATDGGPEPDNVFARMADEKPAVIPADASEQVTLRTAAEIEQSRLSDDKAHIPHGYSAPLDTRSSVERRSSAATDGEAEKLAARERAQKLWDWLYWYMREECGVSSISDAEQSNLVNAIANEIGANVDLRLAQAAAEFLRTPGLYKIRVAGELLPREAVADRLVSDRKALATDEDMAFIARMKKTPIKDIDRADRCAMIELLHKLTASPAQDRKDVSKP